jgi:Zn-dependent M28 family amino/carboxypeptidase
MIQRIVCVRLLVACLFTGVSGLGLYAQNSDAAAGFTQAINVSALKKHLTYIAGEETQGRETGTEGQRKAATYIEAQFKALGLQPATALKGYQQYYPLYRDTLQDAYLQLGKNKLQFGTDFTAPLANNVNLSILAAKMVFVGYGISTTVYDDYAGLDVKGKIVVFFFGEPKKGDTTFLINGRSKASEWTFPGYSLKLRTAQEKGAIAAIIISPAIESFNPALVAAARRTNVYYPRKQTPTINAVTLSHEAATQLMGKKAFPPLLAKAKAGALFTEQKKPRIKGKCSFTYTKVREQIDASNVLGYIEGTDKKDEVVILTAHYDHLGMRDGKIYYGADDDGSGTVGVIQMAEAFAKAKAAGKGPRRTVVFMTVSGEEKGLWGSEYYSENPVFPLDKTSVNLNIDMVGRIDTERKAADTLNYVYVIGHDKLSSDLAPINEAANNRHTQLVLDYKFDDPNDRHRIYFRSDHYNFARKGVPILFFYDGMLKSDYHKPTDTIDKIYWELFEKRVRMIFHTAWEMANRDEMLKRDIPLPTGAR